MFGKGRSMDESALKVRFNLQNWLKEEIEQSDYRRIGGALDIDENVVEKYDYPVAITATDLLCAPQLGLADGIRWREPLPATPSPGGP